MLPKTEAIKKFLTAHTHPDFAALYSADMEVQVNVAKGDGTKIDGGDYKGREWTAFTNGAETWKPFRIPFNAATEPEYNDTGITFSLENHAEGIGMTGWNWKRRVSQWVAFDFDAISGHSDTHGKKLTDVQLLEIQETVRNIPFVTVRKSTSGKGIHLYVFVNDVPTANHNEHAALARSILSMLSGLTGFDFASKIDVCGGNMWVWHRKMYADRGLNIKNDGLKILKQGTVLERVPENWRDHVPVITRKANKSTPSFVNEGDDFEQLTGQRTKVELDCEHKALIDWLGNNNCAWYWDNDNWMLVTHTYHLKEAHEPLHMRGTFNTLAVGTERGHDYNCFMFPVRGGGWAVRRFGERTREHDSWDSETSAWTSCYLNRNADLHTLARINHGVEHAKGGYQFRYASEIINILMGLGIAIDLPTVMHGRKAHIVPMPKNNKIIVTIEHEAGDDGSKMRQWYVEKKKWTRVFTCKVPHSPETEESDQNYDDLLRHIVSGSDQDAGWVLRREGVWTAEPLVHIKSVLGSMNNTPRDVGSVIGTSVMKAWTLVNKPFQPEYPGNREWNRGAAQLAVTPTPNLDGLSYPTWTSVLNHCGHNLDYALLQNEWAQNVGITKGSEFLMLWIASMFRRPEQPMTYLCFFGPQDSGKSIFHEMISQILMTRGVMRADLALQSKSNFNGELANAVLCVVEETDLKDDKSAANRIKDWVTSPEIMIRPLYTEPYLMKNCTKWVQTINDPSGCPIFEGDTRVTLIKVDALQTIIPKPELLDRLRKEAPDFLAAVLAMELPPSNSRLIVPTIETESKQTQIERSQSMLDLFIQEVVLEVPGQCVSASDFYDQMQLWLDQGEKSYWTKVRIGRELPDRFPRGRLTTNQNIHYGNMTFNPELKPDLRYQKEGMFIKRMGDIVDAPVPPKKEVT